MSAVALMVGGDIDGAITLLARAFSEPADRPLALPAITAAMAYSNNGALHLALEWADRAERAETAATGKEALPVPPFMTYIGRCQALAHSGRIVAACAEAERGRIATRGAESLIGQAWLALVAARAARRRRRRPRRRGARTRGTPAPARPRPQSNARPLSHGRDRARARAVGPTR